MNLQEWLGDYQVGQDIFKEKYQYHNETLDEFFDRVSGGNEKLRQLIEERKFLFGGRALSNRGTDRQGSMFNCYSSGYVKDSLKDIMQTNTNLALTYKAQGGQGISLTKIRPSGTQVGEDYVSDGILPFMRIFNTTTQGVSQGGARKGALMMSLDITHKEASMFITAKTDLEEFNAANFSLEIDNDFMFKIRNSLKNDTYDTYTICREYEGHTIEYEICPRKLYELMIESAYDYGEPGCLFTNKLRNYNLMEHVKDYVVETTNP